MALTLNVNSYVTVAEADTYFETRLETSAWDDATTVEQEASLVQSTSEMDNNTYIGYIADEDQELNWPREDAYYFDKRKGLQVTFENTEIPTMLKNAVYEQALHLLTNPDASSSAGSSGTYENISVGSISLSDTTSTSSAKVPNQSRFALKLIKPILYSSNSGNGGGWWMRN